MELQNLTSVSHSLVFAAIVAVFMVLCQVNFRVQLRKLPLLEYEGGVKKRATFMKSAKKLYSNGYQKFKDKAWRMVTSESIDSVVIPVRFLPELRKLSDSVISFQKAAEDFLHTKYTKLNTDPGLTAHAVKADLTPALSRLNTVIYAELDVAMREEMPICEDWTPVYIYMKLAAIVARVSGRLFVGPELCRDADYLEAAINFTMDFVAAFHAVDKMRPWLRPFLASWLPEVQRLRKREISARNIIDPIVQARRRAEKGTEFQRPDDMIQWLMNRGAGRGYESVEKLANAQLSLIFAAIHTTTMVTTNILYTLAVSQQYIHPLREEIRAAMAENGGTITSRALQQMEKVDSFMKETMRFYPPAFTAFNRKVLKGFALSNGQYIPAGATIEVPSYAIYHDSENYPDADTFDGFRFYKLRKQGGATNHARNQFVTTNEQNLAFGYGAHACPGRFFAANEIKMILARIILEYDFKNVDGVTERYPNHESGRTLSPDASKPLLFKKVGV